MKLADNIYSFILDCFCNFNTQSLFLRMINGIIKRKEKREREREREKERKVMSCLRDYNPVPFQQLNQYQCT